MRRQAITAVSLFEMYVQPGTYSAKFLIDAKRAQGLEIKEVLVVDADGKPMAMEFRRWGTKLHVTFTIDGTTPDGVALIDFVIADGGRERFRLWVIK